MKPAERETIIGRLRDFATQQDTANDLADRGSLDRAAEIVALYEDKQWTTELPPPKTTRNRGRPVDPESFSRFTKWLAAEVGLSGRYAYFLRDAHDLRVNYLNRVQINPSGAKALRPLKWLTRHGYSERVPEVWKLACDLAGGKTPDDPTVRRALSQWKHDNVPKADRSPVARGSQALVNQLLRDAHRLMEEYPERFIDAINQIEADAESYFAKQKAAA